MKDEIRINDWSDGELIARHACERERFSTEQVISRRVDGVCVGGTLFSGYTKRSIEMHVAGFRPRWINRNLLWVTFDYPFTQLGCEVVFGRVRASNAEAMQFDLNLGFKEVARVPDVYPDGDLVVLAMYRKDCRFLDIKPRGLSSNRRQDYGQQE